MNNLYSNKIEALINAALADGVLTEKEKQILFKKAQEEGIDLDEFEMVLDARLVELEKGQKDAAPKSNKYGDVRKCPACGALVPALAGACAECGYEFSGLDTNLSSTLLANKLDEIREKYSAQIAKIKDTSGDGDDEKWLLNKQMILAISQSIKTFPIPNTKADLFEFITSMQAQMMGEYIYKLEGEAYMTKYNEAIIKAKSICANDPLFAQIISEQNSVRTQYETAHKKHKGLGMKPSTKIGLIACSASFGLLFLIGLLGIMGVFDKI